MRILAALLISAIAGCVTTGPTTVTMEQRLDSLERAISIYLAYEEDDPEKRKEYMLVISLATTAIQGLLEEGFGKEFFDYYVEREREELRILLEKYLEGEDNVVHKIQIGLALLTALGVDVSEFDWFSE